MAKGTRASGDPINEPSTSELDQTVIELQNQFAASGENRRDKTPLETEEGPTEKVQAEERIHRNRGRSPNSGNSYHSNQSNFTRWSRMEFLRFNGEDLRSWLFKIEQFFSMENVIAEEKIGVAALQLEGEPIQWHLSFMRYRQYLHPATWNDYVMALVERFGTDFDDPMEEIKKVKQVGSVKDYQAIFEKNLTRVNLSQENAISCFLGGLKPELNIVVKITNPTTLSQVYKSARMQEVFLYAIKQPHSSLYSNYSGNSARRGVDQRVHNRPLLPTPGREGAPIHKGFQRRSSSPEEMNEKREKGLCFFCDEKYVMGHKCRNLKQLYILELEETDGEKYCEEEEQYEEVNQELEMQQGIEQMEIYIHALNGSLGYRTLRVTGYHSKQPLHILVDTGSSHNFIDPSLVEQLGCQVTQTTPQLVAAANGTMKVDKSCKISWLLQGAEFAAEFLLLPLGNCGMVLGVQWLLTLGDIKMNFSKLTMEFWYNGRKHLLRGAGKQITCVGAGKLGKLTEPVNKRPYRYPSVKKDIIEELVQQMLDQGIVQPSSSPFASPVVLVGKKDGSWRLCVDYSDLNMHTVKNKFPIPLVEDLLDELGGSVIFSKIDLRAGYHQ
ncbi:hypothetical protein KY290_000774 [Solanum tuberosum]|uniref:Ty3 transposon capsid-like protein domain-containing protein n=1 Tax=Solanum tuberosum TaxID=4113 RepID=A0ABQ7WK92_SOLTU|nr:hypothetical protein KY290_000774 [Solanum tuberosum]